ncbi:MAG: HupE/UreJ family protein [Verrucomicrobia bacterium]|nr:HupE/UreJ family protein [Verrucomicrobiota bacterium]
MSRVRSSIRPFWLWAALLLAPLAGRAHNPDTSYARVTLGEHEVHFRFTYDLFTLQKIVSLDVDRDGRTTRAELQRGLPEIHTFLRRHIAVDLDDTSADFGTPTGFVWPPDSGDAIAEADYHTANGLIHFDFVRPVADTPENIVLAFRFITPLSERHTVLGAFLCGGATHEVTFTRFEPDYEYVTGYESPLWKRLEQFLRLGFAHTFLGYDHLCFLLALVVASRFRGLVKIVTSFTVAHSLTLILAVLDIVRLPVRLVETSIAATIVYVAVQNLRGAPPERRWLLTFGFGLIHGFGFANVLGEMNLPTTGLVRCLLSFNVGVELGQLAFIAAAFPLVAWLRRGKHERRAVSAISLFLALFGAAWFTDRAFNLGGMPF